MPHLFSRALSVAAHRGAVALLGIGIATAVSPTRVAAQGSCQVNNESTCLFGNTASYAITLTVTAAVRLATSASSITLATPNSDDFISGFGTGSLLGISVRANRSWTLTIRATQATWTGVGTEARADRPVGDLQWDTAINGPYVDMTTSAVTLASSASATAGDAVTLYLRARYAWLLDSPGAYSLPLQLTLTAP